MACTEGPRNIWGTQYRGQYQGAECLCSTAPLSCWPRPRRWSSSDSRLSPVPVLTASPLECLATCHPWHARRQGGHILFTLPAPQKARGCPGDVSGHPP